MKILDSAKVLRILLKLFIIFFYLFLSYHAIVSAFLLYLNRVNEPSWWYLIDILTLVFEVIAMYGIIQFLKTGVISLNYITTNIPEITTDYYDVDVFIPIKNEDPERLARTLQGFIEQTYPSEKIHVYVGTETKNVSLLEKYRIICNNFGATLIREDNNFYKAGMLNILLKRTSSPIVLTFDYDHRPTPEGVYFLVSKLLHSEEDVAFVQAKAKFEGIKNSLHAWASLLYKQYFEVVNVAKSTIGTVIYNGTTAAFKRKYLEEVGGFPIKTFTEDAELTVNFLINGYHGEFLNKSCSIGTVPKNYSSQVSQLWRWTHGGVSVFKYYAADVLKTKKLSLTQKIDVLSTYGLFFVLVGAYGYVIAIFLGLVTHNQITRPYYFGVPPSIITPVTISSVYAALALLSGYLAKTREKEHLPWSLMFISLIISVATNPFLLGAVFYAILGKKGPNDPKGNWSKKIHMTSTSLLFLVIGIFLIYSGICFIFSGIMDGSLLVLIGLTLIPTFFLHLRYDVFNKI